MTTHFNDFGLTSDPLAPDDAQPKAGPSRHPRPQQPQSLEELLNDLGLAEPSEPLDCREAEGSADKRSAGRVELDGMWYKRYTSEVDDLDDVIRLVEAELSEPYNLYTFRYFLTEWPHLAYLVYPDATSTRAVGIITCKADSPMYGRKKRGYVAMLSIEPGFRRRGIASHLARQCIIAMHHDNVREVVIETESDNSSSLALYEKLGFVRDKRLHRFYSNGKDAYRLVLALDPAKPPYPSSPRLFPPPQHLHLPSDPYSSSASDAPDHNDDAYSETASEVSHGRWEVASGPEWLETLEEPEALLRGLGGEPGKPEPAPEGAQWMLGQLLRERAEAEMRASQASQEKDVDSVDANGRCSGEGDWANGAEVGPRPDTPALKKPDLPPRPTYEGMYT